MKDWIYSGLMAFSFIYLIEAFLYQDIFWIGFETTIQKIDLVLALVISSVMTFALKNCK